MMAWWSDLMWQPQIFTWPAVECSHRSSHGREASSDVVNRGTNTELYGNRCVLFPWEHRTLSAGSRQAQGSVHMLGQPDSMVA